MTGISNVRVVDGFDGRDAFDEFDAVDAVDVLETFETFEVFDVLDAFISDSFFCARTAYTVGLIARRAKQHAGGMQ